MMELRNGLDIASYRCLTREVIRQATNYADAIATETASELVKTLDEPTLYALFSIHNHYPMDQQKWENIDSLGEMLDNRFNGTWADDATPRRIIERAALNSQVDLDSASADEVADLEAIASDVYEEQVWGILFALVDLYYAERDR